MSIGMTFRQSKRSMRRKLFGYMILLAVLQITALLTAFIIFGRFDSEEQKAIEALDIQMEFLERDVFTHFDALAGGGIQLSQDMSAIIDEHLNQRRLAFANLSDNAQTISDLQDAMIEPLRRHLLQENCSGAFIVLDATVNRAIQGEDYSRTGLYLQKSYYNNSDDSVILYRGDTKIGKAHGIFPHRKWRLEFQPDMIPGWDQSFSDSSLRLRDAYRFTEVFTLPGTSDRVMLLIVPLLGSDGTLYGTCGYEISENYFITYHAQPTKIPTLTCLVVPGEGKRMDSAAALSCGGANGYYRAPDGVLSASDMRGSLKCFTSENAAYVGLVKSITLSPNNPDYTLAVMMMKSDYDRAISRSNLQNIFLWALIIFFTWTSCLYFSKHFLSPILKALKQLKMKETPQQTNVLELDDLFDFLSQKDQEQESVVRALERERLAALRDKENLRHEYEAAQSRFEAAQRSYEAAQQKASRLAYAGSQAIDPEAYAQFLAGIDTLTPAERKMFDYYLEGKTVKEIIEFAGIKESTLRFHNRNIYSKLGVNSLKQMLHFAALMQQDQTSMQNT